MELWDGEIGPRVDELAGRPEQDLYEVSLRVIRDTITVLRPPFEELFPEEIGHLITTTLEICTDARPKFFLTEKMVQQFLVARDRLGDLPSRPGVGPFLVVLERLVESMGVRRIDGEEAAEIFSACYESVVMSNVRGKASLDKELACTPCVQAVALQETILTERNV
ncbi:hypothetical protein [Micromonospora sp. SH-82]|uniref:hypothetical protein n=1 Tax=Micromonospora sp. SH-82 TaxID=3132938 RepID=UPI003EBDCD66